MRSMPDPKPGRGRPKPGPVKPSPRSKGKPEPDGPTYNPNIPNPRKGPGKPKPGIPKPKKPSDNNNPMESDFLRNEKRRGGPSRPMGKKGMGKQKDTQFSGGTGRMGKSTR